MAKKLWTKKALIWIIVAVIILGFGGYYLYARSFAVLPDVSIFLMQDVHEPNPTDRILVITPHPDDETIACAGYIQRSVKNKSKIKVVLVTDGNRRGFGLERYTEFRKAMKILGVSEENLTFLGLPDYYLKEKVSSDKLKSILETEINNFSPTVLFYPDFDDENPDHKFIAEVTDNIVAGDEKIKSYTYLVHYQYFPQPIGLRMEYNLTPPIKLVDFLHHWQKFMLEPTEEDTKLEALSTYKTQLRTPFLHNLLMSIVRRNELFSVR